VVKILQGSVVTQITLGGLTIYPGVANFPHCICAENYENWLAVDKVITKICRLPFLAHPVHSLPVLGFSALTNLHRESKKGDTILLSISLLNIDRFS